MLQKLLTVQLVHGQDVVVAEAERLAVQALVVGVHDRVVFWRVRQAQTVSDLMNSHGEEVHSCNDECLLYLQLMFDYKQLFYFLQTVHVFS